MKRPIMQQKYISFWARPDISEKGVIPLKDPVQLRTIEEAEASNKKLQSESNIDKDYYIAEVIIRKVVRVRSMQETIDFDKETEQTETTTQSSTDDGIIFTED